VSIGIILLAAGSSSRMGQSKQLLKVNDETLLTHATKTATRAGVDHVVVVLGANNLAHHEVIRSLQVDVIVNKEWKKGMGNSLKAGLNYLVSKQSEVSAIVIMVCDQPKLTVQHLQSLLDHYKNGLKGIVASYYGQMPGVPAVFDRRYFDAILALENNEGAKKIILKNPADTTVVEFPEGAMDLDTIEDYQRFQKSGS
jgi:molybdenum cofactor cytidylyltransferase